MIPPFEDTPGEEGRFQLPPGIHVANWQEVAARFGGNPRRRAILDGLLRALQALNLDLFQRDRDGRAKGIVQIDLESIPS